MTQLSATHTDKNGYRYSVIARVASLELATWAMAELRRHEVFGEGHFTVESEREDLWLVLFAPLIDARAEVTETVISEHPDPQAAIAALIDTRNETPAEGSALAVRRPLADGEPFALVRRAVRVIA